MSKKYVFLFPGQGAQYPGMGQDFFTSYPIYRQTFEEAEDILKRDLSKLIFEGSMLELSQTKNSQLAIFLTSCAMLRTLHTLTELTPMTCAGLSLGEYSALVAAEKIAFRDCIPLVERRGFFMQEAAEATNGGMYAILGLERAQIEEAMQSLKGSLKAWLANYNTPGQFVIAGDKMDLEKAAQFLKEKGAKRALALEVSGAFHSPFMESAKKKLTPFIEQLNLKESTISILMNVFGDYVEDLAQMKKGLIDQVTEPVRWAPSIAAIETKQGEQIAAYLEIGPGKTLSGMNKKIGVKAPTLSLEKVNDLSTLIEFLEREQEPCNC